MITVHNKSNNRTITFNRNLSLFLIEQELDAVELMVLDGNNIFFRFFKLGKDKKILYQYLAKLHHLHKDKRALVTICNYAIVTRLCKDHHLKEGDYYFKISRTIFERGKYDSFSIRVDGVFDIPTNEEQKIIEPISNLTYKVSIDKATDQQLYDELIRRGYEGEMSKCILLTKSYND